MTATRVLAFSLLGYVLLVALGPLQHLLGLEMVTLDAPLVIVLYLSTVGRGAGLGRTYALPGPGVDWSGGLTGAILGYLSDVMAGGIKGLHCLSLVVVFLVARRAARQIYLSGALPVALVAFGAAAVAAAVGLAVRWAGGVAPTLGSATVTLGQAVLTACIAPPLMRLLRAIDVRLLRKPIERGAL